MTTDNTVGTSVGQTAFYETTNSLLGEAFHYTESTIVAMKYYTNRLKRGYFFGALVRLIVLKLREQRIVKSTLDGELTTCAVPYKYPWHRWRVN